MKSSPASRKEPAQKTSRVHPAFPWPLEFFSCVSSPKCSDCGDTASPAGEDVSSIAERDSTRAFPECQAGAAGCGWAAGERRCPGLNGARQRRQRFRQGRCDYGLRPSLHQNLDSRTPLISQMCVWGVCVCVCVCQQVP
ncbi:hypothetical protein HJG60_009139 [Phyllostomus discolor]|uniref:Uncharacterized protein n=1 Tax=Phyllostomus discolor TaxID=89673 RepID=A0A834DFS7_9CHIR|nr:hypothetical protein HJG60_009139 [Phyllostomus discolor]